MPQPPGAPSPLALAWRRHSGKILVIATVLVSLTVLGVTIYFSIIHGPGFRFGRGGADRDVPDLDQEDWEAVVLFNISGDPPPGRNVTQTAIVDWTGTEFYDDSTQVPLDNDTWRAVPKNMVLRVTVLIPEAPGSECGLIHRESLVWRDGDRYAPTLTQWGCLVEAS